MVYNYLYSMDQEIHFIKYSFFQLNNYLQIKFIIIVELIQFP